MNKDLKKKVIIDCDPGTDDAIAIMLALNSEELDILGITTVCGNSTLENCTQNALDIIDFSSEKEIPVFAGLDKPIQRDIEFTDEYCGKNGVCDYEFEKSNRIKENISAIDFIYNSAITEEKLTIISTGPMSNLAQALIKYPDLKDMNIEIITMAGYYKVNPDVSTKRSEWNVYVDPEAFEIVCNSGLTIYTLGLDVSRTLKDESIDEIINSCENNKWIDFLVYSKNYYINKDLTPRSLLVDSLPLAFAINNSISKFKLGSVTVKHQDVIDSDIIKFDIGNENANVYAAYTLDLECFVKLLIERVFKK